MTLFRKYTSRARLVAIVAGGAFLSACMTWKTQSLEPERFSAADSTQTVRVVLHSGETLIVRGPVITGDSLTGLRTKPGASADSLERVGVPLAAIDHAEAHLQRGRTGSPDGPGSRGGRTHYQRSRALRSLVFKPVIIE